jgi:hypothetical protein
MAFMKLVDIMLYISLLISLWVQKDFLDRSALLCAFVHTCNGFIGLKIRFNKKTQFSDFTGM